MAFDPWVGKIPWSRKWQSAPVFLTGKSYGHRSLAGHSLWGHKSWTCLSMHAGFTSHSPFPPLTPITVCLPPLAHFPSFQHTPGFQIILSRLTCEVMSDSVQTQFSHSVMSDSLRPHESQHSRPPCSSPTPGVYPNSYPSSW